MARPWGNMNESSLSETKRSRALIVSMKHYLVDHNQVCSNYALWRKSWRHPKGHMIKGKRENMFCLEP